MADWFAKNAPKAQAGGNWFAQNSPAPAAAPARSWLDSVSDFVGGAASQLNPVEMVKGAAQMTAHPIDTIRGYAQQNQEIAAKAEDAFKRGDYAGGVRHVLGYLLNGVPGLGAAIDAAGDKAGSGQLARGLGEAAGLGVGMVAPEYLKKIPTAKVGGFLKNKNAAEAAAMDYLESEGVPVSAASKTGNAYVANVQKAADSTPLGAIVAERASAKTTAGLKRTAEKLANRAYPEPVVPEQAGAGVREALEGNVRESNKAAGQNYGKFRDVEADPANLENVQVGLDSEGKPIHKDIPLPVDMRPVKQALRPIAERYRRSMPIAQQRASEGLRALENILSEDDFKPASIAEMDLGAIKAAARSEMPELRDASQGLAAKAVGELQGAIDSKVSAARRTLKSGETAAAESAPAAEAAASGAVESGPVAAGGPNTQVRVPGSDRSYSARYEVRDLGDIQPSHSGRTFQQNPNYPFTNERDYTRAANQGRVAENATPKKFDPAYMLSESPDATNGAPIIDRNGNVLGGNGRSMILERVYQQNPQGSVAYRKMLELKAPQFGVDPAAVKGMKRPVLVRVVDDVKNPAEAIADFNKKPTAELTPAERMIADSRRVSGGTLDDLAGRLDEAGPDSTLAQVLEGKSGVDVLDGLIKDGAITSQERGSLVSGESLTPAGKARINGMVLGRFFKDPAQLDQMPASIRGKLERIAAPLAKVEGKGAWSLSGPVSEALDLLERSRAAGFDNLSDFINQGGLFEAQNYSPEAQTLARHLQTAKPTELTRMARQYASDAGFAEGGQSLFGEAPTPGKSFAEAFGGEAPTLGAAPARPAAAPKPAAPIVRTGPAPDALSSLQAGRAATAAKYQTAEVLKKLREEPVQAFQQMTYAKDAGIEFLRKIRREAPGELPKVGRAYLEGLFEKAQETGGFGRGDWLFSQWEKLGPETKKMLFENPAHRSDLDKFFRGVKALAAEPNPSKTAVMSTSVGSTTLAVVHPVTGVPLMLGAGALSKLLHSPKGIRLLTEGMKIPVGNTAAAASITGQIMKLIGSDSQHPIDRSQSIGRLEPALAQ